MEHKLVDLIDLASFQPMLDCLNKLTEFTSTILDDQGNILTPTVWQDICIKLQEANLCHEKECRLNSRFILERPDEATATRIFQCQHGMVSYVEPIVIKGERLGSLVTGQVFTEKPDAGNFRLQAQQMGFDEATFMEALEKVPVLTEKQMEKQLPVISSLANLIADSGLAKLKEIETRKIILDLQHDIIKIVGRAKNLRLALNHVLEKVCRQGGIDSGWVYLLDPISGEINLTAHFGLGELFVSQNSNFAANSPIAAILRCGDPVFRSFAEIQELKNPSQLQEQIRSMAVIPILHENQVLAALNVASHYFDHIPEDTRLVLETIASSLGGAIARMNAENLLKESEKKYRMAFNTSPDAINITTMDGTYVAVNQGFLNLTEYVREEIIGFKSIDLDIWANPEDREKLVARLKKDGKVENFESVFKVKNGQFITALMSASVLTINNKPHILSVTRDISERKKIETELLVAKMKAEESDRLKTSFLSNISHELRTPMNGILGFSELLHDDLLTIGERHEYISVINDSARSLLSVITSIVDISKIDCGDLKKRVLLFNLNELLDGLMKNFSGNKIIQEKSHLKVDLIKALTDEQSLIYSDPSKINHIFGLLLDNAAKFTDRGTIQFGYIINGSMVRFFVRDTGKGIPPDKHLAIFERFRQEDETLSRKYGGIGLGLAIAKGLVELLGGKIWVESEPGKGSVFSFEIPFENQNEPVRDYSTVTDLARLRG